MEFCIFCMLYIFVEEKCREFGVFLDFEILVVRVFEVFMICVGMEEGSIFIYKSS